MRRTTRVGLASSVAIVMAAGCAAPVQDERAVAEGTSPEGQLSRLVEQRGLPLVDLSVPLDRFAQAPDALQRLAASLVQRVPGIYVMRYYDDTLRFTMHVFDCDAQRIRYIVLNRVGEGPFSREEWQSTGVELDPETGTLSLTSERGILRLTAQDVTPVSA